MIVVGGGAVGGAVAYFLAREGLAVTLLERGELAGEASGAAAGMLAPIGEAMRGVPDVAARAVQHWGLQSLALFPSLCEELRERSGIDPEYEASGLLRVALSEAEVERLRATWAATPDCDLEWMQAADARAMVPGLTQEVRAALWSPREAHLRSPLLTRSLAGAAYQLGAKIEPGVPVVGLLREGDRVTGVRTARGERSSGAVVVCTGAFAGELGEWLGGGWSPPVVPVRGQIVSLDAPRPPLPSIVWGEPAYLVPKRDGSLIVGATEEQVGFERRVTVDGLEALLRGAPRLMPALSRVGFRAGWAGLRPGSPDGLPGIGPVPGIESLWVAIGHFRNGVLLAPVTGRLVVSGLLGKALPAEAEVFDPARWSDAPGL
ncbi:MAG: glycine oxidase ThiO [Myxococcota bacterium]